MRSTISVAKQALTVKDAKPTGVKDIYIQNLDKEDLA